MNKLRIIFKKLKRDITWDVFVAILETIIRVVIVVALVIWIIKECS